MTWRIGLVGCGKIARDQHLPAIAASPNFEAVATADPAAGCAGLPNHASVAAMLDAHPEIDAVAMCQPPEFRRKASEEALRAGRHVLLEKPPGVIPEDVEALVGCATAQRRTLFAAWHARAGAGVPAAKDWIARNTVRAISVIWKEDVRRWHPGQAWIWRPAGFGVFDPGINALSIVTELVAEPIELLDAMLEIPANRAMPIASKLRLATHSGVTVAAEFDWRQEGPQTWDIRVEADGGELLLSDGGNTLAIDGEKQEVGPEREYPALYEHFAGLIASGARDVDVEPLRLVSEALQRGAVHRTEPFED